GVLPQAAWRLDPSPQLWPDEVRVRVERLSLDAASFRQLSEAHPGDPDGVRREVAEIVATRGKMHNPVTGSGGMLVGVVEEVGPASSLGFAVGDRLATLVSLTLTPLTLSDALARAAGLADKVVIADARDPVQTAAAVGEPADVTVVCVDVAGAEGAAILATRRGGTIIFFSMATSFSAAALGAEGLGADVTMLIGNGYVPGHAAFALDLIRTTPSVRQLFERRVTS